MASLTPPPQSLYGLPASPRANRQMLSPLHTTFSTQSASSSASTLVTPQPQPPPHSPSSLIFINATIPLSPTSSTSSSTASPHKYSSYQGLEPRKRSGFARLFSCFGREERARRRRDREIEVFEKVGGGGHWSEY